MTTPPSDRHAPLSLSTCEADPPESPRRRALLASIAGVCGMGASGLALTGCGGASSDTAALRFVNGTSDYATADFWVDGSLVLSLIHIPSPRD